MLYEARLALRSLLRAPGLSAVIVLTLALGIGATTTIFSVVAGVLLRPLPFADQDRLLMLWQRAPGVGVSEDWFSPTQYFDIRERVTGFEELAIFYGRNVTLTDGDAEPERVGALEVSSSFFGLLGIEPVLGTALTSADDAPRAARKVFLGRRVFERRFRSDPSVIGRTTLIDGERVEIAGVLPRLPLDADILPTLATVPVFDLVMSLPLEDPGRTTHGSENYNIVGKVATGVSRTELESQLLGVAQNVVRDPESLGAGLEAGSDYRIGIVPLLEQVVGRIRLPLVVLLAATGILLLVGCANVANLLIARAAVRRRELAIRAALGAGRGSAIAGSLSEGMLLGGLGGSFGVAIASLGLWLLRLVAPAELPRLGEVGIDVLVLGFAAAVSIGSSLVFATVPALQISAVAPREALGETNARASLRIGSRRLVVMQVALSVVLTVGAALSLRSLLELRSVDPGFRPEGALSFRLSLVGERYEDASERVRFFELLFQQLRGLSGVTDAGGVSMLPFTRGYAWTDFIVEGYETPDERERIVADVHVATPGYFEAMGISILAGRSFREADDDEPPVVIVNRAFAERFWRVDEAVGKWVGRRPEERARIVGVAGSVKHYGLDASARLAVFYPYKASRRRTLFGVVGGDADPSGLATAVTAEVRALDPLLPVYAVRTMVDRVRDSLARQRLLTWLLTAFSAVALTLATIGLYGVLSFTVATRSRELGIRKALGARGEDLYRLVWSGSLRLTLYGLGLGLAIALLASRFIAGLVFGVSTTDVIAFLAAAALALVISAIATLGPARRAASVEPTVTLKQG